MYIYIYVYISDTAYRMSKRVRPTCTMHTKLIREEMQPNNTQLR